MFTTVNRTAVVDSVVDVLLATELSAAREAIVRKQKELDARLAAVEEERARASAAALAAHNERLHRLEKRYQQLCVFALRCVAFSLSRTLRVCRTCRMKEQEERAENEKQAALDQAEAAHQRGLIFVKRDVSRLHVYLLRVIMHDTSIAV